MTLPPVLEDTRDLLLCLYMVLVDTIPSMVPEDRRLHLGWVDVDRDAEARWLAGLIWGAIVCREPSGKDGPALASVINSFEGP